MTGVRSRETDAPQGSTAWARLARHRADLAAYALFLALALLLLWPALLAGEVLLPAHYIPGFYPWRAGFADWNPPAWNALLADSVLQYLPWRHFARESLHAGFLPLWNPHQFCGTPFLANAQSALFYPPNLLFWLLPAARAFAVSALAHLFLAGAFLYLYLRGRGVERFAAALGGATFELCAFVTAWLELPTAVNVMVWLPLAWHLYERARTRSGPLRGLPVTLPLAMILVAGHPQFAFYAVLAFAAYVLVHPTDPAAGLSTETPGHEDTRGAAGAGSAGDASGDRPLTTGSASEPSPSCLRVCVSSCLRSAPAALVTAGAPLLLAAMLAAPQILPLLELSRVSHRAGGSLFLPSAEAFRGQALPFSAAIVLLLPEFFVSLTGGSPLGPQGTNYAEFVGYIGIVATLLAAALAVGLAVPRSRRLFLEALPEGAGRRAGFLFALGAVAVVASFRSPLGELIHALVPGLGRFGSPGRMLALSSVAGSALAGYGAHALLHEKSRPMRARAVAAALLLLGALAAAGLLAAATEFGREALTLSLTDSARCFGLLLLAGAVLAFGNSARLPAAMTRGVLLALVAADLLASALGTVQSAPAALAYPPSPLLAALKAQDPDARVLALTPEWRIDRFPTALLPPNSATFYGLNDINGYDSLYLLSYKRFLNRLAGKDTSPLANGNMVLFDAYQSPDFRLLACRYLLSLDSLRWPGLQLVSDGPVKLYRYSGASPHAYLAASAEGAPLAGQRAKVVEEGPTRVVVALEGAASRGPEAARAALPSVGARHLVLLDSFLPGWRAEVDGRPARITPAHETFRAVAVPPGARRVVFRYEPDAFRFGLFVALAALSIIAGLLAFARVAAAKKQEG